MSGRPSASSVFCAMSGEILTSVHGSLWENLALFLGKVETGSRITLDANVTARLHDERVHRARTGQNPCTLALTAKRSFACRVVSDRVIMAVVTVTRPTALPFRFALGAILWDQQSGILFFSLSPSEVMYSYCFLLGLCVVASVLVTSAPTSATDSDLNECHSQEEPIARMCPICRPTSENQMVRVNS